MEEFGVNIELGFVLVGGVVRLFFLLDRCSLSSHSLAIRPQN